MSAAIPRDLRITYATRRSKLALAQSRAIVSQLGLRMLSGTSPARIVAQELEVVTSGDRIQDRPLADIGGKGLFVKEIEEALLDGRAQFAVHSYKDVPASLAAGLVIACVPRREDSRDVLVSPRYATLDALPRGARVGTSSLRRTVALRRVRPDLDIVALRGNVDTRLRKVEEGEVAAIVLARAGLLRLGLENRATEVLSREVSLPAVGQGALALECRADDASTRALLALLHDDETATCVAAERAVLAALGGDCNTPMGAQGERVGELLRLRAFVAKPDGSTFRSVDRSAPWPRTETLASELGAAVGASLL
ncbi:MAG: hydroxymethylbilane synthase [Polyangiaceae bacterium]